MPSNKPRIATYTTDNNLKKFKIIAAYQNKSMSEFLSLLIDKSINDFESEHGEIILQNH